MSLFCNISIRNAHLSVYSTKKRITFPNCLLWYRPMFAARDLSLRTAPLFSAVVRWSSTVPPRAVNVSIKGLTHCRALCVPSAPPTTTKFPVSTVGPPPSTTFLQHLRRRYLDSSSGVIFHRIQRPRQFNECPAPSFLTCSTNQSMRGPC
jgi:hypothetical protein